MSTDAMGAILNKRYGLQVPYMKLWRAKRQASVWNLGNHSESYAWLPAYGKEVSLTNPGSVFKLQYERRNDMNTNPVFLRCFICFDACKQGFVQGCRKFIGIDGCHLKGRFGGILLSAVSLDGNNGLFPLAYGIVEVENKESWSFFLQCLRLALQDTSNDPSLTFMSDAQKGLADIISQIFPNANIRSCARHLYQNFKKAYPNQLLRRHYWAASQASTLVNFNQAMEAIKSIDKPAYEWLSKKPPSLWSRHAFHPGCKNDAITNNMTESFNNLLGKWRGKPILSLIDSIRMNMMEKMHTRYQKGCIFDGRLTPKAKTKIQKLQQDARHCKVFSSSNFECEVLDKFGRKNVVKLNEWSCSCGLWQLVGIPCLHTVAAISHFRYNIEQYVDAAYHLDKYTLTYAHMIHPIPDVEQVGSKEPENEIVQPPTLKRGAGRPRKNRRRDTDEGRAPEFRKRTKSLRCSTCKQIGHNMTTCQRAAVKEKRASTSKRQRKSKDQHVGDSSQTTNVSLSQLDEVSTSQRVTRSQIASTTIAPIKSAQEKFRAKRRRQGERKKAMKDN